MKSDPENSDFVMEAAASRINEPRPATDEVCPPVLACPGVTLWILCFYGCFSAGRP